MKGCIIYFSGTGNTEYVARAIKQEFANSNILCDTYEVSKNSGFEDKYDFYVFGAPIYAEMFPPFYTEWVKKHLTKETEENALFFPLKQHHCLRACLPCQRAKENRL